MQRLYLKATLLFALLGVSLEPTAALSKMPAPRLETAPPLLTAGILRIESERSYKLSLQTTLGVYGDQARRELDRSIAAVVRMREDLSGLRAANAGTMYDVNEDVLNKLNFLLFSLEAETSDNSSRVVALALRQASLAQRMAKIALLRSLDRSMAEKQGLQVDLAQSRIEFENGMQLLRTEAGYDRQLQSRIEIAERQWLFYETALKSTGNAKNDLRNISTTSDRIAEVMIEIVHLSYAMPLDNVLSARWQF